MRYLLLATAVLLTGCFPSDPIANDPLAIRTAGDTVELRYTECEPAGVVSVALIRPSDPTVFKETDPPVWKIRFTAPARLARFMVGDVPAGATEEVRLAAPLDRTAHYEAVVELDTGMWERQGFELDRLGDQVAYHGKYLSTTEFERESACP